MCERSDEDPHQRLGVKLDQVSCYTFTSQQCITLAAVTRLSGASEEAKERCFVFITIIFLQTVCVLVYVVLCCIEYRITMMIIITYC